MHRFSFASIAKKSNSKSTHPFSPSLSTKNLPPTDTAAAEERYARPICIRRPGFGSAPGVESGAAIALAPVENAVVGRAQREETAHCDPRMRTDDGIDAMQAAPGREEEQIAGAGRERLAWVTGLDGGHVPRPAVRQAEILKIARQDGLFP